MHLFILAINDEASEVLDKFQRLIRILVDAERPASQVPTQEHGNHNTIHRSHAPAWERHANALRFNVN